jgi:hypothetical protein
MNTVKLISNCSVKESCQNSRVNSTTDSTDYMGVFNLLPNVFL